MGQQNPKIVNNNDGDLRWVVHGNRICDKINSRQSNTMSMDKFWEDQWFSQMEGWASLARHGQATNHFTPRACHSPSASESSFTVSTRDSPSLSAQSEASPLADKYVLQSPDLSQGRFCKIGLFNPDVKHAESLSTENVSGELTKVDKHQDWMLLQERGICENVQHASDLNGSGLLRKKLENFAEAKERLVKSPIGLVHDSRAISDEGWLSDGTESWASASSRDLSWNHSCDGADDVPSSIMYEAPNIRPTSNYCDGQGERHWGAMDGAAHATCPAIANRYDDENANILEKQSYADFNDEITSCDTQVCIHEFIPLQARFDDRTSAPALAPQGSISLTKVQFGMHSLSELHAGELETRCFDRSKSLGSRGRANDLNVNMLCKRREVDAYCRRNADCLVEGHQELPVQAGAGHQPFACGLFEAENKALQLQEELDFYVSDSTKSGSSTCMESASHTKQAHLKSRLSAAVEDKYPSSFLHGHFRFAEQDGSQCYSFSVHDSDEVFFARACQPESESNMEGRNCLYTFHSRRDQGKTKGGQKSWLQKEKLASSLVGKLKVSNAKHMRTKNECTEETHFVLYGENSKLPPENEAHKNDQISGQLDSKLLKTVSTSRKSKFSKPTLDSHFQKSKQRDDCQESMPAATASQGVIGSCLHEAISRDYMSRHVSSNFVDVNIACCSNHSIVKQVIPTTQIELAAIVITTTVKEYKVTGKKIYENGDGWGAAFLEKGFKKGWGAGFLGKSSLASEEDQQLIAADQSAFKSDMERLQEPTGSEETYPKSQSLSNERLMQNMSCSKREQLQMTVDVVAILPAGNHGLLRHDGTCPAEDGSPRGPTSLLESWQSGGSCHCGGWDVGCGLSVLKAVTLTLHKTRATIALTNHDRINWITPEKPLQIFTQGWKQKKVLMLEIIQTGIFSLSFQARMSPLQAFATAVAIFHEQITHK